VTDPLADDLIAFQRQIEALYGERDAARGLEGTFVWFIEEVGELARELHRQPRDRARLTREIADVLAWLTTLASLLDIEMADCARVYARGCPKCGETPCAC
jgi:NTP pyrophosphatase (non-canonical NTP hydrolase)